jgi:hypothetical protein
VWPLTLLLLVRMAKGRSRTLVVAISSAAVASAVLMAATYHSVADPSRAYYGTDTRAHELLIGAVVAVLLARPRETTPRPRWTLPIAGWLTAGGLAWVAWRVTDTSAWLYRGGFFGVAIATAVLVARVTQADKTVLHPVLSSGPLRATGRISYGLYLWHWPVLLWLDPDRTRWAGVPLLVLRVGVTFVIATLSYVLVERPVRTGTLAVWPGRRLLVTAAIAVLAVLVAVSVSIPTSSGPSLAAVFPNAGAAPPPRPGPTSPSTTPLGRALIELQYGPQPRFWAPGDLRIQADGHPLADGVVFLPSLDRHDGRPHIVMVGDSVLRSLLAGFDPGPAASGDYYGYSELGCAFLPGTDVNQGRVGSYEPSCPLLPTRWRMLVDRRRPDVSFLLVGAFEVLDRLIDGHLYRVATPEWAALLRTALLRDVDLFASRGGLVALPTVPCFDPPDYGVAGAAGSPGDRRDPHRVAAVNAVIGEVAQARPSVVRIIDLAAFLCPAGHARDHIGGVRLRLDGVHFTRAGARIVSTWLAPRLGALIPPGAVFATSTWR